METTWSWQKTLNVFIILWLIALTAAAGLYLAMEHERYIRDIDSQPKSTLSKQS